MAVTTVTGRCEKTRQSTGTRLSLQPGEKRIVRYGARSSRTFLRQSGLCSNHQFVIDLSYPRGRPSGTFSFIAFGPGAYYASQRNTIIADFHVNSMGIHLSSTFQG